MLPHAGQSQGKRCTAYTLGSFCCGRFPPLWICSNVGICYPFLATDVSQFFFLPMKHPMEARVFQSMSSFSLQHSGSSVPRGANFVIYSWILILSSWIMALTVILTLPLFLGYGVLGCWTLCGTVCTLWVFMSFGQTSITQFYSQNVLYSVVQQHCLLTITAISIVLHLLVTMTKTAVGNIKM